MGVIVVAAAAILLLSMSIQSAQLLTPAGIVGDGSVESQAAWELANESANAYPPPLYLFVHIPTAAGRSVHTAFHKAGLRVESYGLVHRFGPRVINRTRKVLCRPDKNGTYIMLFEGHI